MAALTGDRDTPARDGLGLSFPVEANTTLHGGAMVALNTSGRLVPAAATATLKVVGRNEVRTVNGAVAGAVSANVRRGCYRFGNSSAGDAITAADFGANCYAVDDQTVAKTDGSGARPKAGIVRDVDAAGVWVEF